MLRKGLEYVKEGAELIAFYLWDRLSPDGTVEPLLDDEHNTIYLETASDLWNLLIRMNPAYGDSK